MKNQLLSFRVIITLSLLSLLTVTVKGQSAPAQEKLTLKAATTLLRSHDMFKDPLVAVLRVGEIPADIRDIEHYQPQFAAFKALGWIEMNPVKKPDAQGAETATKTLIKLTEAGKNESKNWKQNKENEWQMPMAIREVVEVIKIHYDKETPVGIEFSWTYTPNKVGEALKFSFQKEKAYAALQLTEGSWKIIRIRAIS